MNERIRSYRDLIVWRRALELMIAGYGIANLLPPVEWYALAAQLRRALVSVPSNIAEGHARLHRGDFLRHLSFARGSLAESDTLLEACEHLGYATAAQLAIPRDLGAQVGRMLTAMIGKLRPER